MIFLGGGRFIFEGNCKFALLLACPNTPTLPNHAHPRDFNENKLIVQKKCYYVFRGIKDYTWWKMDRFHRQLSLVFQFKSGRDWAGRRACLGRKPVGKKPWLALIFNHTDTHNHPDIKLVACFCRSPFPFSNRGKLKSQVRSQHEYYIF